MPGERTHPAPPQYPAIFTKAPTSVIGPYDDIPYDPNISTEIDWECELAVVVGREGKNIGRDEAFDYIFGYMVLNDVSARDVQKRHGGQFFKGKSLDGTCPTGPWIVTADEVGDPSDLQLWTRVNGEVKQHDTTRSMLLDVPGTIESLSFGMTLEPGDIIATGTPAGVGFARTPPEFLHPGDVVECEVSGLRNQNRVAERRYKGCRCTPLTDLEIRTSDSDLEELLKIRNPKSEIPILNGWGVLLLLFISFMALSR